jgi:hypothetical protein
MQLVLSSRRFDDAMMKYCPEKCPKPLTSWSSLPLIQSCSTMFWGLCNDIMDELFVASRHASNCRNMLGISRYSIMSRLAAHRHRWEDVPCFAIFPARHTHFAKIENQFRCTSLDGFFGILDCSLWGREEQTNSPSSEWLETEISWYSNSWFLVS